MKRLVEPGLVALALRRTASLGVIAWSIVIVLVLVLTRDSTPRDWIESEDSIGGLWRQSVWITFLAAVAPILVVRAASKSAPWRRADSAWLASRSTGNATILVSTWIGATLAGLVFAVIFALVAETFAGTEATSRLAGKLPLPAQRWIDGAKPTAWSIHAPDVAEGRDLSARIELGLGPGPGGTSETRVRARRRSDPTDTWSVEARTAVKNRGALEFPLPRGTGDIDLELSTSAESMRVYVEGESIELWESAPPHSASITMLARCALALAAWIALAIGVSTWTSTTTAALSVPATWAPFWWSQGSTRVDAIATFLPGARIFDDLAILSLGRAPAFIDMRVALGASAVLMLGFLLGIAGLRSWRSGR